ncbi:MAG: hypothetical protein AB4352_09405 [Hormoscilla sp.]
MNFVIITLLVLGTMLLLPGIVWMGIQAFADHPSWGLAYLLIPGSWLAFFYVKWQIKWRREKLKIPFVLKVLGYLFITMSGIMYWLTPPSLLSLKQPEVPVEPSPPPEPELKFTYKEYMDIGSSYYRKQDYNTALINFRRALVKRPDDKLALQAARKTEVKIKDRKYQRFMLIGLKALKKEDYDTAIINFSRALQLFPDNEQATRALMDAERAKAQSSQ